MAEILRLQSDDENMTPGEEKGSMVSIMRCFQSMVSYMMCDTFRRRF